jgi:hypothetical protein
MTEALIFGVLLWLATGGLREIIRGAIRDHDLYDRD